MRFEISFLVGRILNSGTLFLAGTGAVSLLQLIGLGLSGEVHILFAEGPCSVPGTSREGWNGPMSATRDLENCCQCLSQIVGRTL